MHGNQLQVSRIPFLGRVTGHDVRSHQLLLFVPAVWVPARGELTRSQGCRFLALVAVFMAILAGCDGGLTGGSHAGEGFMQEGVEAFAASGVLVDVAHGSAASLRPGLHVLSFKPLSRGHVTGLGADWVLHHPEPQQQEQKQRVESCSGQCHLS